MLHAAIMAVRSKRSIPQSRSACVDPVEAVREILSVPDADLSYDRAKLGFDQLVDPSVDSDAVLAELDRMVKTALKLAGPCPTDAAKLKALRKLIYVSGPWNDYRPFEYDHSNVRGQDVRLKLISHYLRTRRGDCVSMPVLFVILADKLGLPMALSLAPHHLFLKYRLADGRTVNLEATSGALPARDEWLRQVRSMSDHSIASGLYMRPLSKREGIASMAMSVVQHLRDAGRFEETAAVCKLILQSNHRDGLVLANLGIAYQLLGIRLLSKYRDEALIPLSERPLYWMLASGHRAAFARARDLGWGKFD